MKIYIFTHWAETHDYPYHDKTFYVRVNHFSSEQSLCQFQRKHFSIAKTNSHTQEVK